MKNTIKLLGIIACAAIIGFSMTACGDEEKEDSAGKLTITGLGDYNGKFVYAETRGNNHLFAAAGIDFKKETITGGKISGGSVTLKVWKGTSSYSGNDTVTFNVGIFDKASITDEGNRDVDKNWITVTFKNGVAKGTYGVYDDSDDDDDDDDDWEDDED